MTDGIRNRRTTGRTIGIDLGTTDSVVSILEGGEAIVVADAQGSRTTPSVVAFAKNGEVLVGEVAKRQAVTNVDRTIRSVKREMGTSWTVEIDGKKFTPQQISAFILQKLKKDAEAYLGEKIADAVITVPACFNDAQRQATKEAGQIAGLNVLRIINEPTSAALAYGLGTGLGTDLGTEKDQTILVFDLGGGTYDVSLLDVGRGGVKVRASSGDDRLGGDDWDMRIVEELVTRARVLRGVDLSADETALRRLREVAEKAKIDLSDRLQTTLHVTYGTTPQGFPLLLDETLTRYQFELITEDLLERCKAPFHQVTRDAGITSADIAKVVLIGGATRMPAFSTLVRDLTGREPAGVVPDEAVALGAALRAGVLGGEIADLACTDLLTGSVGIETRGGVFTPIIERGAPLPARRSEIFTTAEDDQKSIKIAVFQGEGPLVASAAGLGRYELTGIAPAPRGLPQFEITFSVDAGGVFSVSAKDLGTGRPLPMTPLDESANRS